MLGRAQTRSAPARGGTATGGTAKSARLQKPSPWQGLRRQAGWGLATAAALSVALLSSRDDMSRDEMAPQWLAGMLSSLHARELGAPSFDAETAARQLAQALRSLADDRDRLAIRLNAVEHEMRDLGGTIKLQIDAAKTDAIKTAKQAPPWPDSAPPVPMTLADVAVMVKRISPAPVSTADSASAAAVTNTAEQALADASGSLGQAYGVDLGAAATIKTLHQRWATLRTAHPQLFEGVQPVVSVKQNARNGRTELHLIVGPYANAESAAQFCDYVVPFHVNCQPAMFDGSRLALQ
jgi:hypothetical protein